MKQVCVLGNGQLGRMLRQAGEPLGIAVWRSGWTLNGGGAFSTKRDYR